MSHSRDNGLPVTASGGRPNDGPHRRRSGAPAARHTKPAQPRRENEPEQREPEVKPTATYKTTEMMSAAETVMLPKLRAGTYTRPDGTGQQAGQANGTGPGAEPGDRLVAGRRVEGSAAWDAPPRPASDGPVTVMPDRPITDAPLPPETRPLPIVDPARPEQDYTASHRRKWVSRAVLLGILAMQAVFSLRLHNTAFEDEAQYLYAGRLEIAHLFHGAPLPIDFASFFSGAPVLYPILGAAANSVGGLAAARAVSLLEMLATTALLYAITRRLFNERAGLCAALLFSVTASVIFLGNFATFDATCLFLLAVASWIMVRTALFRWPVFLLAAPVAALAVATKYAGLLFVPTVAVLPALVAWPYNRRRAYAYPAVFGLAVAALLFGALRLGGHSYLHAIESTTTSRAQGDTPVTKLLWESVKWGGLLFGAALFGTVAYTWRPRTEQNEQIAPAGSRLRRGVLGSVLTGTALLAPAYQAHIHTDVSFHKHIGFGLFFAAPIAGIGLARIIGDHFRRPQLGVAVWGVAILLGVVQSAQLFGGWGNTRLLVAALARQLKPGARYLVEVPEVPTYYLMGRPGAQPTQFYSTFFIAYVDPQGKTLTGDLGFETAVQNGFFNVVAYEGSITPGVDSLLARELQSDPQYRLAAVVPDNTAYHVGSYYVWVKKATAAGQKSGTGKSTGTRRR